MITDDKKETIDQDNLALHTEEHNDKISDAITKWHKENDHPFQGKTHTPEARKAIGAASKGRKHSAESVKKRAEKRQTKQDRANEIIQAYLSNKTFLQIVEEFKISQKTIYAILDRNNIPRR